MSRESDPSGAVAASAAGVTRPVGDGPAVLALPAALGGGAGRSPGGAEWIARLPQLVDRAVRRWGLTLGDPFPSGSVSWCAPVTGPDGADLVLKVAFPHDEARHEAAVLRAWQATTGRAGAAAGGAAVRLVAHHEADWALLLERVRPGTPMRTVRTPVVARLAAGADVLRVLHAAPVPDGLPALRDVAARSAGLSEQRAADAARGGVGVDVGLLRAGVEEMRRPEPRRVVQLHGDLNPGNLLRGPHGWVALDPKALRGDPAYDAAPLLEQVGDPWRAADPRAELAERTRLVADRAGLDAAAVAGWALARATDRLWWDWAHGVPVRRVRGMQDQVRVRAAVRDRLTG
ncbi:aminoglycoside phosphotransferase family protein [Cellulomonas sp. C5510]|uniref:aminoglycoside phosphotransferase family protein n=1 Tax=Cellulomonas sp. C5510 TaxID=2871170 RepID=UPI001C9705FA|nr:aminoglycoside phosphotransferase family protein [Cellulomonas sp. C5510]QZN87202.1 aminoglycoside phosphotransferase family protein [Cellulomonas sp. C5510]